MTHIRRSLKYFLQITLIFVLTIGILMLSGFVSKDVAVAFQQGWTSVAYILGLFLLMSFAYPFFGYGKRTVRSQGDPAGQWDAIDAAMAGRGYQKAGEMEDGGRKYRLSSATARVMRLWEDGITIRPVLGGFQAEGLVRDLSRIVMAIDRKINDYGN